MCFLALGAITAAWVNASRWRKPKRSLVGKVVVITGGSRGLGLALSQVCLAADAKVVTLARDSQELERVRMRLMESGFNGGTIHLRQCDVTNENQVENAIAWVELSLGPVSVLINNAGVISVGAFENQSLQSFQDSMNVNFFGALHSIRAVLPAMLQRAEGQIVNIASIGGLVSVPHLAPYSASKFALVGFSRGLAIELRGKGVDVLTVYPWLMRTGSHLQAFFSGKQAEEYRWFSLGATLPVLSVEPRNAALEILRAIEAGGKELLISRWSALTAALFRTSPSFVNALLVVANRLLLPKASPEKKIASKGAGVRQLEWRITRHFGDASAVEWNQIPTLLSPQVDDNP